MRTKRVNVNLIFLSTGASNDLKHATSIANNMVKEWGMSEKVGLRTIEEPQGFQRSDNLGPNTTEIVSNRMSANVGCCQSSTKIQTHIFTKQIDAEIKKILTDSYERAKLILKNHAKEHKALAEALLKYETLDAEDIKAILTGDVPN